MPLAPEAPPATPNAAEPGAADLVGILDRGQLRIAVPDFDAVPFVYDDNGRLGGTDVEMGRDIARQLGVEPMFLRRGKTFDELVDVIADGQADVAIGKISRTLRRAARVRFTRPYLVLKQAMALNRVGFADYAREREPVSVLRDYDGSIGVIRNSSFSAFAIVNFPDAQPIEFETWDEVLAALRSGRVLAAYRDEFEIKKLLIDDPAPR
ncbi:substrate-binding periplasmic protein [Methylobrevis pamukkalensis]|uniref:substrate-binding periplasmic protein n=1 Tax=Methylobrevis pamukkalensis TaxID=1439726 RepID=UPI001471F9C5|nr:transporter substrate-binding domain-containing protein [Methylobrevis pamukkalensis]